MFKACYCVWPNEEVVVEADGEGGATLMIVEGDYPIDYLVKQHQSFASQDTACDAADEMLEASYR